MVLLFLILALLKGIFIALAAIAYVCGAKWAFIVLVVLLGLAFFVDIVAAVGAYDVDRKVERSEL